MIGIGDLESARALIEQELPLAMALGTPRAIGMALHVAALLDRGEARIQALKRATTELARSETRLECADALCDYGAALRRANRHVEARPPLQAALTIARGAAPLRFGTTRQKNSKQPGLASADQAKPESMPSPRQSTGSRRWPPRE